MSRGVGAAAAGIDRVQRREASVEVARSARVLFAEASLKEREPWVARFGWGH
jgi:hypothetical protein